RRETPPRRRTPGLRSRTPSAGPATTPARIRRRQRPRPVDAQPLFTPKLRLSRQRCAPLQSGVYKTLVSPADLQLSKLFANLEDAPADHSAGRVGTENEKVAPGPSFRSAQSRP